MKKILLSVVSFAIIFAAGIFMGGNTINSKQEDQNALSQRQEIVFAVSALEEYKNDQANSTLSVVISHIYAARELSEGDTWNSLHELWNALMFADESLDLYIDELVLALGESEFDAVYNIAMNMRIADVKVENSNIDWQDGQFFAVAFLGYGKEVYDYEGYIDVYFEQNEQVQQSYIVEGDENYLIIPRYPENLIKVVSQEVTTDGFEIGDVLYEISGENHFAIKCNVSDIYSNVLIQTEIDGSMYEFSPFISLKDGELAEIDGIFNLEIIEN